MANVKIRKMEDAEPGAFPAIVGVTSSGAISTRAVVAGEDRPITTYVHELPAGATISWSGPRRAHALYLWHGTASADGTAIPTDGMLLVEHGATATLTAGPDGATLVHYQQREDHPSTPSRAGGHVHITGPDGIHRGGHRTELLNTLLADSTCPHCEIWLHRTTFFPRADTLNIPTHFHTEDEVIFVLSGKMMVGTRTLEPGTALAIDANTTYGFRAPPEGLNFINFRPETPYIVMMNRGRAFHAPVAEGPDIRAGGQTMAPIIKALRAGEPLPEGIAGPEEFISRADQRAMAEQ